MDEIRVAPLHSKSPGGPTVGGRPIGIAPEPPRRNFFVSAVAFVIGSLVGVVPFLAGIATYLDPLSPDRKKKTGTAIPLTTLDSIPDASAGDVLINQYPVIADRVDAWNLYPQERIGSVYLVVPKGTKEVKALNTICPHLGCAVDTQQKGSETIFYCPCHTSSFTLDGTRIPGCVAPRNMDELQCITKPAPGGGFEVSVVYQSFQPGLEEKKVKS